MSDKIGAKELHAIGTCGECKHWQEYVKSDYAFRSFLQCTNFPLNQGMVSMSSYPFPPKDFGCIHWEQKR